MSQAMGRSGQIRSALGRDVTSYLVMEPTHGQDLRIYPYLQSMVIYSIHMQFNTSAFARKMIPIAC